MKKLNKLDLSGVEHLSDQDAKEYVADSASSDCIQEADDLSKSGSEGGSGGQIPSTGNNIQTDEYCVGHKEGDTCSYSGQRGTCLYRKFTIPVPILPDGEKVKLVCVAKGNTESGVELSQREYACLGLKVGDKCSWITNINTLNTGYCHYKPFSPSGSILHCGPVRRAEDEQES